METAPPPYLRFWMTIPPPPLISRSGSCTAYALIKFASLKKNFPEFRFCEHTQKKDVEVWQKNFRPVSRVKISMQILTVLTCQECGNGLCMCSFQTLSMVFNVLLKISRHGLKRGMWCKTFRGIIIFSAPSYTRSCSTRNIVKGSDCYSLLRKTANL